MKGSRMKSLLASLFAALFALSVLPAFAAAPLNGASDVPHSSTPSDDEKDKDKDGGKKSD
jgi:hypothetical protein